MDILNDDLLCCTFHQPINVSGLCLKSMMGYGGKVVTDGRTDGTHGETDAWYKDNTCRRWGQPGKKNLCRDSIIIQKFHVKSMLANSSSLGAAYMSVDRVSIASDHVLSPIRRQAIIWTNAGLLSFGHSGTKFGEILIKIQKFSFTKMHLKI